MQLCPTSPKISHIRAFTLVELLLSMAILSLLTLSIFEMMKHTQDSVTRQQSRAEEFREARAAVEAMSRTVSSSVMNSYWAYGDYSLANRVNYTRQSDNHFISGPASVLLPGTVEVKHGHCIFFQTSDGTAPLSGNVNNIVGAPYNLVTCMGYYIDYGSDLDFRPSFIASDSIANPERKRFRLMEFRLPAQNNILYSPTLNLNGLNSRSQALRWYQGPYAGSNSISFKDVSVPLADNILAMILQPRYVSVTTTTLSESASNRNENSVTTTKPSLDYYYDSREKQWGGGNSEKAIASHHQLPPVIELTIFAAEERAYDAAVQKEGDSSVFSSIVNVFADKFTNYTQYTQDVEAASKELIDLGIKHRTFTTNIVLRGSKWIVEEKITP